MAEAIKGLALGTSPFPQWQDVLVAVYHLVSSGDPGLIHCMVKVCPGDSSLAPVMRLGGPKGPGRTQTMSPLLSVVGDSESLLPQWGHPSVFQAEELYLLFLSISWFFLCLLHPEAQHPHPHPLLGAAWCCPGEEGHTLPPLKDTQTLCLLTLGGNEQERSGLLDPTVSCV